ncbi:hypothetical protein ACJX0J_014123, partial [Zea mays]
MPIINYFVFISIELRTVCLCFDERIVLLCLFSSIATAAHGLLFPDDCLFAIIFHGLLLHVFCYTLEI